MSRALDLATQALGWCSPNPGVGAVLVRDGAIVGEGFTQPPGTAHAEVRALYKAGHLAHGSTLYVTLEPCSHQGRTPPCTDALISAGVAEVHVATADPSPWVNGGGIQMLRDAGVRVVIGERELEARELNEAYFKWVACQQPFVTLKYAMTADGRIATRAGSSQWVTGPDSREYVALLRSRVDAILVGIGTVLADDPLLTARPTHALDGGEHRIHQPLRVVLDSEARLPLSARVVSSRTPAPTLVCVTERAQSEKLAELADSGVETLVIQGQEDKVDIIEVMNALGRRNITSVLAEPGGTLAAGLLAAGAVDKVLVFIAPKIVGGVSAPGPVGGEGVAAMSEALELRDTSWTSIGRDMLLSGYVGRAGPGEARKGTDVFRDH
ncbi:MAG: bifunctional diaminohydroxyphosphoribosylaminopyrimidine deaminase/5-amino-6-(5-phosphoribosylamino)uracil reductase RibD [Chloroflexi bacterium]|nr:bifunctional diaminohydroxyphosphoribosylaminopyrimidine deaminase/5-amino-6-(5-phosphoribosylamino)uracil reductase RibD [Chloroflexota bacterium]